VQLELLLRRPLRRDVLHRADGTQRGSLLIIFGFAVLDDVLYPAIGHQQPVLDALADGFQVYLAVDAVGSRHDVDYQTALRRMESSGAVLTTTEAALFEWCDVAGTPEFKQISVLVRESEPIET
jgi:hypothetical protein